MKLVTEPAKPKKSSVALPTAPGTERTSSFHVLCCDTVTKVHVHFNNLSAFSAAWGLISFQPTRKPPLPPPSQLDTRVEGWIRSMFQEPFSCWPRTIPGWGESRVVILVEHKGYPSQSGRIQREFKGCRIECLLCLSERKSSRFMFLCYQEASPRQQTIMDRFSPSP